MYETSIKFIMTRSKLLGTYRCWTIFQYFFFD